MVANVPRLCVVPVLGVVVAYQFMFEYKLHFSVFTLYSEHAEIGGTMLEKVGGTLNVIP